VGFYDQEACAAVCPVDCCVPDPKIPETEAVLLERAKKLHPETTFGADFPSRFRKEGGEESAAVPAAAPAATPAAAAVTAPAGATLAAADPGPDSALPIMDDWEIPIVCRGCEGEYTVAFQYLRPGVVFYCPHCQASFVPTRTTYLEVAGALERFSARWQRTFEDFQARRQKELAGFEEKQRAELADFEERIRGFTGAGQAARGTARRRWFS
jgi:hypothetical protein